MSPEELDKELEGLWAKVGAGSEPGIPPQTFTPIGMTQEFSLETIALLKRQHHEATRRWTEILESKERQLATLKNRLEAVEAERNQLEASARDQDARYFGRHLEVQAELEAGLKGLEAERQSQARELASHEAILKATRERLAAETARFKKETESWLKREERYLLDLKELQADAARYQQEAGRSAEMARSQSDGIKDAKSSLENALSELTRERETREDAEKERIKAMKKVAEVESHIAELSKIWDEERAQWRELWDRERSTWETQRTEFSSWEENLRKEREAWQAELKSQEKNHIDFVAKVNETLRNSSETGEKLSRTLKLLLGLEQVVSTGERQGRRLPWRWLTAAALAAALAFPIWKQMDKPRLRVITRTVMDLQNPTAMAFDGALLAVAEYDGRILAYDPADPRRLVRQSKVAGLGAYRPQSLAFGREQLWSADSAQARLVRHKASDPAQILASRSSPGAAPTAVAFDGQFLWSFDAAAGALYRHGVDESDSKAFSLGGALVPTAMAWIKGRLWVYDSKISGLAAFDFKEGLFSERWRVELPDPILGLVAVPGGDGKRGSRELWVLAAPPSEKPALIRYGY